MLLFHSPVREYARGSRKFVSSRSEEHTSELQSHVKLVCRLLLEKKIGRTDREVGRPSSIAKQLNAVSRAGPPARYRLSEVAFAFILAQGVNSFFFFK